MSQLLSLGAINKLSGEYVYPKIANKKDEYICPSLQKYYKVLHFIYFCSKSIYK